MEHEPDSWQGYAAGDGSQEGAAGFRFRLNVKALPRVKIKAVAEKNGDFWRHCCCKS